MCCFLFGYVPSLLSSPLFVHLHFFSLSHTAEEVVLQPVDVEMQSPPTSASSSSTHETPTSAAAANDSGLGTIQEIKKRLEEHRR